MTTYNLMKQNYRRLSTLTHSQYQPYDSFQEFESDDPVGARVRIFFSHTLIFHFYKPCLFQLIPLVNQLQEAITVVGGAINFPQIVVVGRYDRNYDLHSSRPCVSFSSSLWLIFITGDSVFANAHICAHISYPCNDSR